MWINAWHPSCPGGLDPPLVYNILLVYGKIKIYTVTDKKPLVLAWIVLAWIPGNGIKDHPTIGIIQISVDECTRMESVFRQKITYMNSQFHS
jgi:hypothetical protein